MKRLFILAKALLLLNFLVLYSCQTDDEGSASVEALSSVEKAVAINEFDDETQLASLGGAVVSHEGTSFYIGYRQVSAQNQDPVLVRFDNGKQIWARTDYETTGDDNTGYGLLWDKAGRLYAVFSATGTQGSSSEDFRRFATDGWLKTYGQGGGAKIAIIARINPVNGDVESASYLSAVLSNGNSNSLVVTELDFDTEGNIRIRADSWFSPRNTDTSAMVCEGSSPFDYQLLLSPDLSKALDATAGGCN